MEIAYSGDAFHTYMVISSEEWGKNEDEEKMIEQSECTSVSSLSGTETE